MEEFELKLRISPSDIQFKKLLSPEAYVKLKSDTFKKCKFTCQGCGFHPFDENKAIVALSVHVIEINEEKPEDSICNILCKACHSTQHIDVSVREGWVELVNSTYSQKSLVEMCRINAIHNSIKEDDTRRLKIAPIDYIDRLKEGNWPETTKVKVIFTSKFEWGDL